MSQGFRVSYRSYLIVIYLVFIGFSSGSLIELAPDLEFSLPKETSIFLN